MEKQKTKLTEIKKNESQVSDGVKTLSEAKSTLKIENLNQRKGEKELTQREAVYIEVMKVIKEEKIMFNEGQALKPLLSEIHIKKICIALVNGFQNKKIVLKDTESNRKKLSDTKIMELYCLSLLNNWLRRDKRLNGVGKV